MSRQIFTNAAQWFQSYNKNMNIWWSSELIQKVVVYKINWNCIFNELISKSFEKEVPYIANLMYALFNTNHNMMLLEFQNSGLKNSKRLGHYIYIIHPRWEGTCQSLVSSAPTVPLAPIRFGRKIDCLPYVEV